MLLGGFMTVKKIIHNQMLLMQPSEAANAKDMKIAIDLRDTLLANRDKAAGLAANMIGKNKRIIAFYIGNIPMIMINPQIEDVSGEYTAEEGCLSLSGTRQARRYQNITVSYQDINLEHKIQRFSGFISETIQHEVDHCNGILI